jgi:hypothetical protein
MDKSLIRTNVHNFFSSLVLVPIVMSDFLQTWLSINRMVGKAQKTFSKNLLEMGVSKEKTKTLTKEYAALKDEIFDETFKKKSASKSVVKQKISFLRTLIIKLLPCGQVILHLKNGDKSDIKSAILLDFTKTVLLVVGIIRGLDNDAYWVGVCIFSYLLYSLSFGIASGIIEKHQNTSGGLLGSVFKTIGATVSDTKVIALVSMALSVHAIIGAPFVPLYHVIPGLDFVEHYISGFGIGLFASKLYISFIGFVSYTKALALNGAVSLIHQVSLFESNAELPFITHSSIFVGLIWEGLEEIAEKFTPRVINRFFWNGAIDVVMVFLGALTAYKVVCHSSIIKKHKNSLNLDQKNAKINVKSVRKATTEVLDQLKSVMYSIYSETAAKDTSKLVGTYQLAI